MTSLSLSAPAKLNLFLHVTGRLPNGYHTLQSIFVLIDLCDTIELTLKEGTEIHRTGDIINADINQRLIENIFFKNSPLHDGAMIISHKRIRAAGCILPVSHNLNIPKELGLRHRAALGISQETDALAIIVSEETGGISIANKGEFHLKLNAEELESMLTNESNL